MHNYTVHAKILAGEMAKLVDHELFAKIFLVLPIAFTCMVHQNFPVYGITSILIL